ncbi:hypothetical protein BDV96DRAFT_676763 [Lophiotrema nucula]|uniref:DUF7707 domain-containing protein n=1 Tax=Lophiotrema nucula TaxID=690887 RepID=A0A6A5YG93_9PLEO|nr:hypothetical protein BDV96DRAFT_676763 [Lophiotrema nucula]
MAHLFATLVCLQVLLGRAIAGQAPNCCDLDISTISNATKDDWCESQRTTCQTVCMVINNSTSPTINRCDAPTLEYDCACDGDYIPGELHINDLMDNYRDTIPSEKCSYWKDLCFDAAGANETASFYCSTATTCATATPVVLAFTSSATVLTTLTMTTTNTVSSTPSYSSALTGLGPLISSTTISDASTLPTTTPSAQPTSDLVFAGKRKGLSPGTKAGIALGVLLAVGILLGAVLWPLQRKRKLRKNMAELDTKRYHLDIQQSDGLEVVDPYDTMLYRRQELPSAGTLANECALPEMDGGPVTEERRESHSHRRIYSELEDTGVIQPPVVSPEAVAHEDHRASAGSPPTLSRPNIGAPLSSSFQDIM